MRLIFSAQAWDDYLHWQEYDPAVLSRLNGLIKAVLRTPFVGTGKPEPLIGNLKGFWARRITQEHRLIYRVSGTGDQQSIEIAACRFHYKR